MMRALRACALTVGLVSALAAGTAVAPVPATAGPPAARAQPRLAQSGEPAETRPGTRSAEAPGAVIGSRIIGRSVQGRAIRAFHLGEPGTTKVVLVSVMHGNEAAPRQILRNLKDGAPIRGVDLWVIPSYNPDGLAAGTRTNARGVDLNRNFPHRWADLDGTYESGAGPASEPETRGVMRFLRDVRPSRILSFHQPLFGVDRDTKTPSYSRSVAAALELPRKSFSCGGVCHGTMVGWFNAGFRGTAITAEYGAHPSRYLMRVRAPRQVLSIWGAHR